MSPRMPEVAVYAVFPLFSLVPLFTLSVVIAIAAVAQASLRGWLVILSSAVRATVGLQRAKFPERQRVFFHSLTRWRQGDPKAALVFEDYSSGSEEIHR